MSNFPARPYLPPTIQRFYRQLIYRIVKVLLKNVDPAEGSFQAALNVLDVLTDWFPMGAGQGFLRIEIKGSGSLAIIIQDSTITISFLAALPFGLPMDPLTVFKLDNERVTVEDEERTRFALLLLRRATWSWQEPNPNVDVDAKWTWNTSLRPNHQWVAWREEAKRGGLQAPTSQHWLADYPQDLTGA